MKVRLIYETDVPDSDCSEQFDVLIGAVNNLKKDLGEADSLDDLSDVFLHWDYDEMRSAYNNNERTEDTGEPATRQDKLGKG